MQEEVMENEKLETSKKINIKNFIKKYSYYLALGFLIAVLAIAIIATSNYASSEEKTTPTNVSVITFSSPILNGTISKGYSATELQYNSALKLWEVHKAVDFVAEIGTDVLSCYDGKVTSISTNLLEGTVVEIDHGDGLVTRYGSLDSAVSVNVGDIVSKGDRIGKASSTATGETTGEGEVHFEVWKDGNLVDPANYLDMSYNK